MADSKVSALSAVSSVAAANELYVNEAGTSKKASVTQLKAHLGNTLNNYSVAAQSISATTAYVTGSNIAVPTGLLAVGTTFHWRLGITKSGAGSTAGCAFLVKTGTLGTTGDTTRLTFTTGTPTGVVDTAYVDIFATMRTIGSGTSAVLSGTFRWTHNLQITGFSTLPCEALQATSSGFDSTTASLIVGLTITTTTASVWSVENVYATVSNL